MNIEEKIALYQEVERRGLLGQLPQEKQELWAEIKRRGLDKSPSQQETQQPQQTQEPSTEYSGPSYLTGATREFGKNFLLGSTPYIAGGTNVLVNDIADITHGQDLKTRAKGVANLAKHLVVPASILGEERFEQGIKSYEEEQEKFGEAYPKTTTSANVLGTLGSFGLGGAKLAAGARTVLANAPKAIRALGSSVAAFQPLAIEKGVEESLKEDSTISSIAKATGIGELEALTWGLFLGALNPFEAKIVARASKMTGNLAPFAKYGARAGGMLTEGLAVGM